MLLSFEFLVLVDLGCGVSIVAILVLNSFDLLLPKPNEVVVEKCKKYGKIAGFWNSDVTGKAEMGFRFLVVDGDIHSMQAALAKSLKEKRELMEKAGVL